MVMEYTVIVSEVLYNPSMFTKINIEKKPNLIEENGNLKTCFWETNFIQYPSFYSGYYKL